MFILVWCSAEWLLQANDRWAQSFSLCVSKSVYWGMCLHVMSLIFSALMCCSLVHVRTCAFVCVFNAGDRVCSHCTAHILWRRYLLSQEKHAGCLTVSPTKIYSSVKEGVRAKLHFKSGCEVEIERERTIMSMEEEKEKSWVGGWEEVSGLMGFKLQPEENRGKSSPTLISSSWKKMLQQAGRREGCVETVSMKTYGEIVLHVGVCICVSVCIWNTPIACRVPAAVLLSSPCRALWQTTLRFTGNPLVFKELNFKAAGGGFWFSAQSLNHPLPANIPECCIPAHIWMETSDPVWSRWDGGDPVLHCYVLFNVPILQRLNHMNLSPAPVWISAQHLQPSLHSS